jgi:hypothetical protein
MTASHAFPTDIIDLFLKYLFSGFRCHKFKVDKAVKYSLDSIWSEVSLRAYNITISDSIAETSDQEETRELNKLESEYWLLLQIIDLLSSNGTNHDRALLNQGIHFLDQERESILKRLKPLKIRYYSSLSQLQDISNTVFSFLPYNIFRKIEDQKNNEKILTEVYEQYSCKYPSKSTIKEMIKFFEAMIGSIPRSKNLYTALDLIRWMDSVVEDLEGSSYEAPQYSKYKIRAKINRNTYHIYSRCSKYPRVEKLGDEKKIRFYTNIQETKGDNLVLCKDCNNISKRLKTEST